MTTADRTTNPGQQQPASGRDSGKSQNMNRTNFLSLVCLAAVVNRAAGATTICTHPAPTGALFQNQVQITQNAQNAQSVAVGDFNGDRALDLVSTSGPPGKIAWYDSKTGNEISIFTGGQHQPWSVVVGDFNGDSYLDIASLDFSYSSVTWFRNTDGLGNFSTPILVTQNADDAYNVAAGDFNSDGALDLASSYNNNNIAWYQNIDGKGNFSTRIILTAATNAANFVLGGDFNGDGWFDLASSSYDNSKIAWYIKQWPLTS